MILKIHSKNQKVEVGDIIQVQGYDTYLICNINGRYVARNLDGKTKLTNETDTLDGLNNVLEGFEYNHFSHREYLLKLESINGGDK